MAQRGQKITPKEELKVVADYIDTENYTEAGRRNNVSDMTARRKVDKHKDLLEEVEKKKDIDWIENYLAELHSKEQEVMKNSLDIVLEHQKDRSISDADNIRVYGIIYDKWLKQKEIDNRKEEIETLQAMDWKPLAELLTITDKDKQDGDKL